MTRDIPTKVQTFSFGLILFISIVSYAPKVQAAACCMSATSFGTGRLLNWEAFAVGIRSTLLKGLGYWDTQSRWQDYSGYSELEWRSELWTIIGLSRRGSVQLRLPFSLNSRTSGSSTEWGMGISDLQLGGRYEILSIGEYRYLPAIAVQLNVTIPTGRGTHQAKNMLGTDVTGRGFWAIGAGLTLEKAFSPLFIQLVLATQVPLPSHREDLGTSQQFGVLVQGMLIGGIEFTEGLVLSVLLRGNREGALSINGQEQMNSSRVDLGAALAISWRFTPHWTVQTSIDSGLYTHGWGDNQPGRITWNLGLRYGYF